MRHGLRIRPLTSTAAKTLIVSRESRILARASDLGWCLVSSSESEHVHGGLAVRFLVVCHSVKPNRLAHGVTRVRCPAHSLHPIASAESEHPSMFALAPFLDATGRVECAYSQSGKHAHHPHSTRHAAQNQHACRSRDMLTTCTVNRAFGSSNTHPTNHVILADSESEAPRNRQQPTLRDTSHTTVCTSKKDSGL